MSGRIFSRSSGVLAILAASLPSVADDNPSFTAICEDVETHAYRNATDMHGNPMIKSWSTDEMFNMTWRFRYEGGNDIRIDGDRGHVLAGHPGVLTVADNPSSTGIGAGIWVYALHVGMEKVVASQVNAYGGFEQGDQGIKVRSTELECSFNMD